MPAPASAQTGMFALHAAVLEQHVCTCGIQPAPHARLRPFTPKLCGPLHCEITAGGWGLGISTGPTLIVRGEGGGGGEL